MVTLSNMAELRIWDIQNTLGSPNDKTNANNSENDTAKLASLVGTVKRQGRERGVTIRYSQDGSLLGLHGTGKILEIYRVRNKLEIAKSFC